MDDRPVGYDDPDFAAVIETSRPLTIAEWDDLIATEQNVTAEPYNGRNGDRL